MTTENNIANNYIENKEMKSDGVNIDGFKKMLDKALKDPNFDPDKFIDALLAA